MGDLQVCSAPSDNGVVSREDLLCTSTSSFQSFPVASYSNSSSIPGENWEIAERRTDEILCRIRPTVVADKSRKEIISYIHDLITTSLGCEVFTYGSVPLKTYLPDGDIDLTAISNPNIEESLVSDVHAVLKREELNKSCRYQVKDVQRIDAEVKLVKCLVENIVVDISFNQLGGLCKLCFLERVDGLVGKEHLFKRSIILIKAWCYYESRILGAHHGLISTYALETLVLCVFHLFHSSLNGPLAVLYRFLEYLSKFDWENYCVSLNGPVCKSSLPNIAATVPACGMDNVLLSAEFLQECAEKFSVPSRGFDTNCRAFPQKHLNIIDALKENNNLGRSVNRGNFYRIRSAFKYGARKLGQILLLPSERLVGELNKFFANTLERHESQRWTDFQNFSTSADHSSSTQQSETGCENCMFLKSSTPCCSTKIERFRNNLEGHSLKLFSSLYQKKVVSSQAMPELNLARDAKEVVAIGILSSRNVNDSSSPLPSSSEDGSSLLGKSHCVPPHCNENIGIGNPHGRLPSKFWYGDDMSFALWPESKENSLVASNLCFSCGNHVSLVPKNFSPSTPVDNVLENSSSALRVRNLANILESSEPSNSLLDLGGHYESYVRSLIYGKCYYLSASILLSTPMSQQLENEDLCKTVWQSIQSESGGYSKVNRSSGLGHQFCPVNPPVSSNFAFSSNEKKKSTGTGTYFPKMSYLSNRVRPLSRRERFQARKGQLQVYENCLVSAPTEVNMCGEAMHELSQEEYPALQFSDSYQPHPSTWGSYNASVFSHSLERHESGSHCDQLREVPLPEVSTWPASETSHQCDSASSFMATVARGPNSLAKNNQERVTEQSYHLKNEVDFPPLCH